MDSILARMGLLLLAAALYWLGSRLHSKAGKGGGNTDPAQKKIRNKKVVATALGFFGGACAVGTFIGDWVDTIAGASPLVSASFFLIVAGIVAIDWWSDGVPDRPAFIAAAILPIAAVVGFAQVGAAMETVSDQTSQIGQTIKSGAN